jgi:hypothetical protein
LGTALTVAIAKMNKTTSSLIRGDRGEVWGRESMGWAGGKN